MIKLRKHIIKNNKCNICQDGLCPIDPYKTDVCLADMGNCPNLSIVEEYFNGVRD